MKRTRWALGSILASAAAVAVGAAPLPPPPVDPPETCQYVHVTDPCQNDLLIFNIGEPFLTHNIPLNGMAAMFEAGGVDFARVPGYESQYSFVTQGPYLRVIKHELAVVWRTVDVELALGISGLRLNKVYASGPVTIGGATRYPLYLAGYQLTAQGARPYWVVLNQQALVATNFQYESVPLGHGALCVEGIPCVGSALDISAGAAMSGGPLQEAFATVIDIEGSTRWQRIFRLTLEADGSFDVSLDPWNDEGVPFAGAAHRSIGLDWDRLGLTPYGLFQTTSVVSDLLTGESSCALPGDPTDIEVWGPDPHLHHPYVHFVTVQDPSGDRLLVFPGDVCPSSPSAGVLSVPVGDYPRAVGISTDVADDLWVYTANKNHGITAAEVHMGTGNSWSVEQVLDVPFAGCPADIAFRDPEITVCNAFEDQPDPAEPQQGPGIGDLDDPDTCPAGSTDPACIDPGGPGDGCSEGACRFPGR